MILVAKAKKVPNALTRGIAASATDCDAYDGAPKAYDTGAMRFAFNRAIYGHASVKKALKEAQHHKCCYCEARFDGNYDGDVEHYRPKGAVEAGGVKILPGYYWLAYSWPNLFYACADCNQYSKRAAFPLANEADRARNHHANLAFENPLLLDPSGPRNPRQHIRFNDDVPTWTSPAGKETISRIKLDREGLSLSRLKHFRLLDALLTIVRLIGTDTDVEKTLAATRARADLRLAMLPDAVFSAASSDYLASHRALWDV